MTLEMQEKAPFLGKREFEIFGRYHGASFRDMFNPKQDIDGWYRNTVFWEPVTGMNLQQKVAIAYEGKAAKLWDSARAMELVGVEDPTGMVQRVEQEDLRMAENQARMQAMLQPQGGPGGGPGMVPGGQAGSQPVAAGGGAGQSASPPPTMIARPPGLGSDRAQTQGQQPAAAGVSIDTVRKALELVADKLKGTVALIGTLAQSGSSQHIQAVITDDRDYSRVLPVLRALDPQAQVKQMAEDKWPKDAVRIV